MIVAPYDNNRKYDAILDNVIENVSDRLNVKEDDFLLLCVGLAGTGKSMLMLHCMEKYLGDKASVSYIGLNKSSFAQALHDSTTGLLPRFCSNDEANVNKRESMSKYNKDLMDLYLSIRGLRTFHYWCNPSLDMMDKYFIEERIKGVIFIATKDYDRPRIYYYFRKNDILKIWRKYNRLDISIIKRVCKKYAYYKGWFKDYDGVLLSDYKKKKDERMSEKVIDFYERYGDSDNMIKRSTLAKKMQVTGKTIQNHIKDLLLSGEIRQEDISKSPTGIWYISNDIIPIIESSIKNKVTKRDDQLL